MLCDDAGLSPSPQQQNKSGGESRKEERSQEERRGEVGRGDERGERDYVK